ncbi:hypothetical protein EDB80DRAFT_868487 [Ilyonectria destructans]|nr:hypothetical protein EDB80DRAFT_868487 [Ilyonectria destructans]
MAVTAVKPSTHHHASIRLKNIQIILQKSSTPSTSVSLFSSPKHTKTINISVSNAPFGTKENRQFAVPLSTSTALSAPAGKSSWFHNFDHHYVPAGQLLKGATDEEGKNISAALLVGINLDLKAEPQINGDLRVGLY